MSADVLSYVQSKARGAVKRASANEVHVACFFCNEDPEKRGRLYINVDPGADIPGLFFCHRCQAKGSLVSLKKHFGDAVDTADTKASHRREILASAAAYYHECLSEHPTIIKWLRSERGLSLDTISQHQLGWADGKLVQHLRDQGFALSDIVETGLANERGHDFFQDHVIIPYISAGNVVMLRGKEIGGKYLTPPGQKTRLFNSDVVWHAQSVVVTEGEFDCLIAQQWGFNAVGVPGANTWQESWDEYFSSVPRIYLVFDPDEAGRRGAEKIKERLSPRVRIVDLEVPPDMEESLVDLSWHAVHGGLTKEGFENLIAAARGGLLVTVADAIVHHTEMQAMIGMKFGVPELDAAMMPGLLQTQVMTVLARSGVGKTLWLINHSYRMAQAQPELKFFFVSLEQTRGEWWERARRVYRFYNLDATDRDAAEFWQSRFLMVDKNRLDEETLVSLIGEFEYEMGASPHVLMLDYVGYWAQAFRGKRYDRTSDASAALKAIAKEHNVAIIAPHQLSRKNEWGDEPGDDARDSGVLLETSDHLITLWNPDDKIGTPIMDRKGEIHCRIQKSRHGGKGVHFRYQWAPMSLVMVPYTDPLRARAETEMDWRRNEDLAMEAGSRNFSRLSWEDAIERHFETAAVYDEPF